MADTNGPTLLPHNMSVFQQFKRLGTPDSFGVCSVADVSGDYVGHNGAAVTHWSLSVPVGTCYDCPSLRGSTLGGLIASPGVTAAILCTKPDGSWGYEFFATTNEENFGFGTLDANTWHVAKQFGNNQAVTLYPHATCTETHSYYRTNGCCSTTE